MPLTGQAKTDYQCDYMRKRRSNQRSNATTDIIRPLELDSVRPKQVGPVTPRPGDRVGNITPEPQSYNPMMVGYVPPVD